MKRKRLMWINGCSYMLFSLRFDDVEVSFPVEQFSYRKIYLYSMLSFYLCIKTCNITKHVHLDQWQRKQNHLCIKIAREMVENSISIQLAVSIRIIWFILIRYTCNFHYWFLIMYVFAGCVRNCHYSVHCKRWEYHKSNRKR